MSDAAVAGELLQWQQKCALSYPQFFPQCPGRGRECVPGLAGEAGCRGWAILPKEKDRPLPRRQFKGSLGGKGGQISSKRRVYLRKLVK